MHRMVMDTTTLLAATLVASETVAEGTTAFHFSKPDGFAFKPGQAIDIVLPVGRHAFSIVSAPFEDRLTIATRMRPSDFKRALAALAPGDTVGIDGPFGSLTLHNNRSRAAVFVAGGIGITPFVSILRQAAHDRSDRPLALLYSNRRPEDAAFLGELEALVRAHTNIRLLATMTEMSASSRRWEGETRLIDVELVNRVAAGLPSPIFYLAGPPAMVDGVRKTLAAADIDDDDIRAEEFHGY